MNDMAKISVLSCDECDRVEPETKVLTYRIVRPGRAGAVDLCPVHAKVLEDLLKHSVPRQPSIRPVKDEREVPRKTAQKTR